MKKIIAYLKDIHALHSWSVYKEVQRYQKRDWATDLFKHYVQVERVCGKCGEIEIKNIPA